MLGRSTTKAIHLLRRLTKLFRDRNKGLHIVFIDMEKAYDSIPREILWECLEKKGILVEYIRAIKDMYKGAKMSIRTAIGDIEVSAIDIGLYQGFALSSFLLALC